MVAVVAREDTALERGFTRFLAPDELSAIREIKNFGRAPQGRSCRHPLLVPLFLFALPQSLRYLPNHRHRRALGNDSFFQEQQRCESLAVDAEGFEDLA